jgi:hypothetical protein
MGCRLAILLRGLEQTQSRVSTLVPSETHSDILGKIYAA